MGLWLFVLVVFIYGVRLLGGGGAQTVQDAGVALAWTSLVTCGAFYYRSREARDALVDLATLSGANIRGDWGTALARASLIAKPVALAQTLVWLCWMWHAQDLLRLPWLLMSFGASMLALASYCTCISGLAHISETIAPQKPTLVLLALLIVPALLASVIPELPSLLDAYEAWLQASISLGQLG